LVASTRLPVMSDDCPLTRDTEPPRADDEVEPPLSRIPPPTPWPGPTARLIEPARPVPSAAPAESMTPPESRMPEVVPEATVTRPLTPPADAPEVTSTLPDASVLTVPCPLDKITSPPTALPRAGPAANTNDPPCDTSADPAAMLIEPLAPPVACPLARSSDPVLLAGAEPDTKETWPLAPTVPPTADPMLTAPDADCALGPLDTRTSPPTPVADVPEPPAMDTIPPALAEEPADTYTPPPWNASEVAPTEMLM